MKWLVLILFFFVPSSFAANGIAIYNYATIPKSDPVFTQIQNPGVNKTFTVRQGDTGEWIKFQIVGETSWPTGQPVWIAEPVEKGPGLGSKSGDGVGATPSATGSQSAQSGGSGGAAGNGSSSNSLGTGGSSVLGNALSEGATSALISAGYNGLSLVLIPSLNGPMEQYQVAITDLNNARLLFTNTVIGGADAFNSAVGTAMNALNVPMAQLPDFRLMTPSLDSLRAPISDDVKTVNQPICARGSIIRTDNSALGESVGIVGTPFNLVYFSDRVPGRKEDQTVDLQLTGASTTGLSQIEVEISDGKNLITKTFNPSPNLNYRYESAGLNVRTVKTKITYKRLDGSQASRVDEVVIGHWTPTFLGLGGWTVSLVHHYEPSQKKIYFGNGMARKVNAIPYQGGWLVTDQAGTEAYVFDRNGYHLRTVDTLTNVILYSFRYDSFGAIQSLSDSHQNTTIFKRSNGSATAIVAPFGQITRLSEDRFGWLSTITDPNGSTYQMNYSPAGLLLNFTKPNGSTSTMNYDSQGLLVKDMGAGGDFTELLRKQSGPSTEITLTTASQRQTRINIVANDTGSSQTMISSSGLETKIIDNPQGQSWNADSTGLVQSSTNQPTARFGSMSQIPARFSSYVVGTHLQASGATSESFALNNNSDPLSLLHLERRTVSGNGSSLMQIDNQSRFIKIMSAEGRSQSIQFNDKNDVVFEEIAGLAPIRNTYDSRGRIVTISQDGRSLSYHYDSAGNLDAITDAFGAVTRFSHDAAGRVISKTSATGAKTEFGYDAMGNVIRVVTPNRSVHQFGFNAFEKTQSYTAPSMKNLMSYDYNLDRQLTAIHLPDGKTINLIYNEPSGALAALHAPDASVDYEYAPKTGQLTMSRSKDAIANHFRYIGPMISNEEMSGEVHGSIAFTYEKNFRLASVRTASFTPVNYGYDRDGLIKAAGQEAITRDSSTGNITGLRIGALSEAKTYNRFGELTSDQFSINGKVIFNTILSRDKVGRITSRVETLAEGMSHRFDYRYDRDGRLWVAYKDGAVRAQYLYDANGNRSNEVIDPQDRLLKTNSAQYAYTDNGDLRAKKDKNGVTYYSYDSFGNLKSVTMPNQKIDYLVDGQNRRVAKKVNGILAQGFLYQSKLQVAAEIDSSGNAIKQFVYGTRANVPDYMITQGRTYAIISDHLGSPRIVFDVSSGEIKQELEYDEFGQVIRNTNPGFIPFGFAGGLYDQDTGLVRFGARDYDPATGRWTAKDPLGFGGGDTNLYGYVLNDPVNLVDSDGLFIPTVIGAVIGGASGYLTTHTVQGTLIGIGSGALASTSMGGSLFGGAVIGAGTNILNQLGTGASFYRLDFTSALVSGLAGATGAFVGTAASRLFQIPFAVIGRPVGTERLLRLSNDIISSGVGGVAGSGMDVFGQKMLNEHSNLNSCPL